MRRKNRKMIRMDVKPRNIKLNGYFSSSYMRRKK